MAALDATRDFRYWAFISYSHQDEAWARWLHRALERWRIPPSLVGRPIEAGAAPARLQPVFRDRDELPTASDLGHSVTEALRQSWSLIVVCSPAAATSRWVNEEVRRFRDFGRAAHIHCVLVGGDAGEAPAFPAALRDAGTTEPIAADLRRHGDGRAVARMKLVAGILGVRYDQLAQREHQRSYLRLAAITATSLAGVALLAAFSAITLKSRREAESQRAHAEALVEFMLGDLRARLAPEGRLATLDAVGKTALDYYAAQDPATLDATALASRARALRQLGEVYDQRGHLDDALAVFRDAEASTGELLARAPADPQRIYDHAQSAYWVGLIAWRRGQSAPAERAFRDYLELAQRLIAIDPSNASWQAEVGYANSNLGTLLLGDSRVPEAATRFENALAVAQRLAQAKPTDADLQYELAQAHGWLADVRWNQMRIEDAIAEREQEVAIYDAILDGDPRHADARSGLLVAEAELGNLSLGLGRVTLALAQLRRATTVATELVAENPESAPIARDASAAWASLGEALAGSADATDSAAARDAIVRARALVQPLTERDPSVVGWQVALGRASLLQAEYAEPDPLAALRRVQAVQQRLSRLHRQDSLALPVRQLLVQCLYAEGNAETRLGDATSAAKAWQRLDDASRSPNALAGPRMTALQAIALRHLGRNEEAAPLLARLRASGYRPPWLATVEK